MASEYKIHKPYVLATLPRPLDHTEGRIVAREVYGQRDGQKKRKRTELVVGVDGETASIYDVGHQLGVYPPYAKQFLDPSLKVDYFLSHPTSRILHLPPLLDKNTKRRQ